MSTRRSFLTRSALATLALPVVSGVVAACTAPGPTSGAAGNLTRVRTVRPWIPDIGSVGTTIAEERGLFRDLGLDVISLPGGPNTPDATVRVSAGEVEIGCVSNMRTLVNSLNSGNDFVIFGCVFQDNPAGVLSMARTPIQKASDIIGKRILGQPNDKVSLDTILKLNRIEGTYQLIPGGFAPDPLLQGVADAMVVFVVNQPIILEQRSLKSGQDFHAVTYGSLGFKDYSNMFFAKRSYVEENRDTVVRFMKAVKRGWEFNEKNLDAGVDLTITKAGAAYGLDATQQRRQNELQIPLMKSADTENNGLLWMSRERMAGPIWDAYRAAGFTTMPDVNKVVDVSILEDAAKG